MAGAKGRSGGKRDGAGRSPFKPTQEQRDTVSLLSAFGMRVEDMLLFVKGANGKPITENTLAKYFKAELAEGKTRANVGVAKTLYQKALEGDNTCMIFWLKTRAGWKDAPQRIELTGAEGQPIATTDISVQEFERIAKDIANEV